MSRAFLKKTTWKRVSKEKIFVSSRYTILSTSGCLLLEGNSHKSIAAVSHCGQIQLNKKKKKEKLTKTKQNSPSSSPLKTPKTKQKKKTNRKKDSPKNKREKTLPSPLVFWSNRKSHSCRIELKPESDNIQTFAVENAM